MKTHARRWLLAALILLGIGEAGSEAWKAGTQMAETEKAESVQQASQKTQTPVTPIKGRQYSSAEVHAFLDAARHAEAIQNPLRRCIDYPNPPGSHWSPAAIEAYCKYHLQSVISFDEAQALIQNGHAADLDRLLEQDLQLQFTRPESRGLLEHTFYNDFDNSSFDVRSTLDAWKRASPSSAFAYAASGWAYLAMASAARGDAYICDTPQSNIDAMDRLLTEADADLQRAVALNPKITPVYVAMIRIGSMSFGQAYTLKAAKRGLAVAPDSYAIYGMYSGAEEPRWGGTLQLMQQISDQAQAHVKENPLLILLKSSGPADEYDVCNCDSSSRWDAFPAVFDDVSSASLLFSAGYAANNGGHPDLAAIYLSEGLRFLPDVSHARMRRDYALTNLGDSAWALEEANRWIKKWPQSPWGFSMRGYAYKSIANYSHAAPDLEQAATLDPTNTFPLIQLGKMYVYETREWDKGWDVADRLVHTHPQDPEGWILRASIQKDQPRDGLRDTVRYFLDHFGDDPDQADSVAQMRAMLPAAPGKTDVAAKSAQNP